MHMELNLIRIDLERMESVTQADSSKSAIHACMQ